MPDSYAKALWVTIQRGAKSKEAVESIRQILERDGRMALLPRIVRSLQRHAAREGRREGVVLSVARQEDARRARSEIGGLLPEMGIRKDEVTTQIDEHLIGGWRLEGRDRLADASYKKYLLDMYNAATKS
ncbi:MAG: hypothetical protein UY63_C0001G0028 [Parcubacteria group bacterium GW2011_GWA2_51_10]|nr:MAG: hypothetical protein UY63_C0001G0028 [Parcubacteria group bacterium GW2011_GWA2_51_10]